MKIGMVLFSHMGHTRQLGEAIQQGLEGDGHHVSLTALETQGALNLSADFAAIQAVPLMEDYDVFLLGSPVHGGRISAPMRSFLAETDDLEGKPCFPFVTHFFRRSWGADQALAEFTEKCSEKGGRILETCAVRWFSLQRKKHIQNAVQETIEVVNLQKG